MLKNLLLVFALGALAVCAVYVDINKDLVDSAENGDMIKVKSLIKQGADVNAKNKVGETVLNTAKTDEIKTIPKKQRRKRVKIWCSAKNLVDCGICVKSHKTHTIYPLARL